MTTIVCAGLSYAFRYWISSADKSVDTAAKHYFIENTVGVVEKSESDDAWEFSTAKDAKYGEGTLIYIEEIASVRNGLGGRRFICGIQLPSVVNQGDIFYLKSVPKSEGAVGTLRVLTPRETVVYISSYVSPGLLSSEDNVEHGSIRILSLTKHQVVIRFDTMFKMIEYKTVIFDQTISLDRVYNFSPMKSLEFREEIGSYLMFD